MSRVLPLGDDDQFDLPRRAEFWHNEREFGVVEEWIGWIALRGLDPLSDTAIAGLRGLVKEFGEMAMAAAIEDDSAATDPSPLNEGE